MGNALGEGKPSVGRGRVRLTVGDARKGVLGWSGLA
jgi:hypothetical protein